MQVPHSTPRYNPRSDARQERTTNPLRIPTRRSIDGVSHLPQPLPDIQQKAVVANSVKHEETPSQTVEKQQLLGNSLEYLRTKESEKSHKKRQLLSRHTVFVTLAAVIIATTGYVSIDTWLTNRSVGGEIAHATAAEATKSNAIDTDQKPNENPLPKNALADYHVAGPNPRALYISKIGLAARILPMSVDSNDALQAPSNIFDTGWYTGSVKPGQTGAMLIDGHSSGATKLGEFGRLSELTVGDTAVVETGDGTKYTYKVVATETVPEKKLDMQKALLPYGNSLQGLNFITCAGTWTKDHKTMVDRLVVYTVRV